MKIITVANQKGGVGKTATASALIGYLKQKDKKILAIDFDAQRNLTACVDADETQKTILDVFKGLRLADAIQTTGQCDFIASHRYLPEIESELARKTDIKEVDRILKKELATLKKYDYVILDTPPTMNAMFSNVLVASQVVLIPLEADTSSLYALQDIVDNIKADVKVKYNDKIKVGGVFLTRHNPRTILAQALEEEIADACKKLKVKYIDTPIRESVTVKEAKLLHQNIFDYAPKSKVCADYKALFDKLTANKVL